MKNCPSLEEKWRKTVQFAIQHVGRAVHSFLLALGKRAEKSRNCLTEFFLHGLAQDQSPKTLGQPENTKQIR